MLSINFYISLYSRTRTESASFPADTTSVSILLFPLHKNKCAENIKPFIDLYLVLSIKVKLLLNLCSWIWSSFITQLYMGSNLKQCFCLIANNNIRSAILEIKNDRRKIVKILIFCSLSREHLLWKCSWERERSISILTILHLSFSKQHSQLDANLQDVWYNAFLNRFCQYLLSRY